MASRADEYRRLARQCLDAAQGVQTGAARTSLREMAQHWLRLAEEQDWAAKPVGASSQPMVQRQQQPTMLNTKDEE